MYLFAAVVRVILFFNRYWIEQVDALHDYNKTKPTVIVGTHVDKVSRGDRKSFASEMESKYSPSPQNINHQLHGHFFVNLSEKGGVGQIELKSKLIEVALHLPQIGIANVKVPQNFVSLSKEITTLKCKGRPYIFWQEYLEIAKRFGMRY